MKVFSIFINCMGIVYNLNYLKCWLKLGRFPSRGCQIWQCLYVDTWPFVNALLLACFKMPCFVSLVLLCPGCLHRVMLTGQLV